MTPHCFFNAVSLITLSGFAAQALLVVGVAFAALVAVYFVVFEVRMQWRVYRIANRPQRAPGYIYDRDKERLPL